MRVLMKSSKPLSFDELKKAVNVYGDIVHDAILEEVLVDMKRRKVVSYKMTSNGNITGIESS